MKKELDTIDYVSARRYCESYNVRVSIVIYRYKLYIAILTKRQRRKSTDLLSSNEMNLIIENEVWLQSIEDNKNWPLGSVSKDLEAAVKSKWIEIALKIKAKQNPEENNLEAA